MLRNLFQEIKDHIDLPLEDYRVASIGLHPAIAQYNGFYTLDSYNNFYPLTYKYQFRKIIENELEKNKRFVFILMNGADVVTYLRMSLESIICLKKTSKKKLKNLQLNIEPFKRWAERISFLAVPIENAEENQFST